MAGGPQRQALVGTGKGAYAGRGRRGRIPGGRPGKGEAQRWGRTQLAPDEPGPELCPHRTRCGVPGPASCVWTQSTLGWTGREMGPSKQPSVVRKEKKSRGGEHGGEWVKEGFLEEATGNRKSWSEWVMGAGRLRRGLGCKRKAPPRGGLCQPDLPQGKWPRLRATGSHSPTL